MTHYKPPINVATGGAFSGVVSITCKRDDDPVALDPATNQPVATFDDPPVWSKPSKFTVWEFTISNGAGGTWLPQLDNNASFTATISPSQDHLGNTMASAITFMLTSSREPGYCMNATREPPVRQWNDTRGDDPDLKFPSPDQTGFRVTSTDPNGYNRDRAQTWDAATNQAGAVTTASVEVRCLDYGAFGSIGAQANVAGQPMAGARLEGTSPPDERYGAPIPVDDLPGPTGNDIADCWGLDSRPEGDADDNPLEGENVGDGVVKYEEYRGFIINGAHFRSDPGQKMLWLVPENGDSQFRERYGIGDAGNLMTAVYRVDENGLHPVNSLSENWNADRRINWMTSGGHGHTDQKAVRIVDGFFAAPWLFGTTIQPLEHPMTPNNTDHCAIYTFEIRMKRGPSQSDTVDDAVDVIGICSTIAHEVGHSVNIDHYQHRNPPGVDTVMVSGLPEPPPFPTQYDNSNPEGRGQMRLH